MKVENPEKKLESAFRITMADGLRPLAKVNFLLGVSSYTFSPSGHLQHPHKRFNRFRVVLTLILISFSATTTVYRMAGSVLISSSYSGIIRFNKMVELFCHLLSNLNPLMLILISLFKINTLDSFFFEMGKYNAGVSEFAEPEKVKMISKKFLIMHLLLTTMLGCIIVLRMMTTTQYPEDVRLRYIFSSVGNEQLEMILNSIIVTTVVIMKHSAIAFIECFNLQLATCITRVIRNMTDFILKESANWKEKYLRESVDSVADVQEPENSHVHTSFEPFHYSPILSPISQQQIILLPSYHPDRDNKSTNKIRPSPSLSPTSRCLEGATPGQQICYVIRKMERVATMQNVVNNLFGPVLALDVGFTVLMVVTLKYLLIRNIGLYVAGLRSDMSMSANINSTIPNAENNGSILLGDSHNVSVYNWAFFMGFDICYSIRLLVITIGFGKVYKASMKFNCTLSKVLGKAQRVMDLLENGRKSEEEDVPAQAYRNQPQDYFPNGKVSPYNNSGLKPIKKRKLVTPTEANTVLTFITSNTAQPIAFSAGGLFTFSGSTILLIVSIIISYVVFLLQA